MDPRSRSGIMAWESALEGAVAAVLGNAAVGFLAQRPEEVGSGPRAGKGGAGGAEGGEVEATELWRFAMKVC